MSKHIFFLSGLCLAIIIMLANTIPGIFAFVQLIPFGDKFFHFLGLGIVSFFAVQWVSQQGEWLGPNRQLLISATIACVITLEEFSQIFIPTRQFDLGDMVVNLCGIVFGLVLYRVIIFLTRSKPIHL